MELKLAEYKNGKFERFLNFPEFGYYGDFISLSNELLNTERAVQEIEAGFKATGFNKDKKDPLNRFNGLFDGRTYGNGQFVLIKAMDFEGAIFWLDYIYESCGKYSILKYDNYLNEFVFSYSLKECPKTAIFCCGISEIIETVGAKYIGNLHENPELFLKI